MTYFFGTFYDISEQKLHKERIYTTQQKYVHSNLVPNVFNIVHKYATMAEAHGNSETEEQLISIGTFIITNAHIFADAVEKWNITPAANKNWKHFKSHFTIAQTNYKKYRPTKNIKSQGYTNHANVIQDVLNEFTMRKQADAKAEGEPTAHIEAQSIITEYKANSALTPPQDANLDLQSLINTVYMLKDQLQRPTNIPPYHKP